MKIIELAEARNATLDRTLREIVHGWGNHPAETGKPVLSERDKRGKKRIASRMLKMRTAQRAAGFRGSPRVSYGGSVRALPLP